MVQMGQQIRKQPRCQSMRQKQLQLACLTPAGAAAPYGSQSRGF
jgi:hypothetical protein